MLATEILYLALLHSFSGYYLKYLPLHHLQVCVVSLAIFKGFKVFWPCFFATLTVKVINNFWKVQGIIDRFNKSRRHIASVIVKTAYESMSAIHFCITP